MVPPGSLSGLPPGIDIYLRHHITDGHCRATCSTILLRRVTVDYVCRSIGDALLLQPNTFTSFSLQSVVKRYRVSRKGYVLRVAESHNICAHILAFDKI